MKMVDMSNAAWDSAHIIFPGLNNCHGIVYATSAGLFAYHAATDYNASYNTNGKNKIVAFIRFITNHSRSTGVTPIGLYGLSPLSRPENDVDGELRHVAAGLNYTGRIHINRWSTPDLGWGSTWVEVKRAGSKISATIERYESAQDHADTVINDRLWDQQLAKNDGSLATMPNVDLHHQTNAATARAVTKWKRLNLPSGKGKGLFS